GERTVWRGRVGRVVAGRRRRVLVGLEPRARGRAGAAGGGLVAGDGLGVGVGVRGARWLQAAANGQQAPGAKASVRRPSRRDKDQAQGRDHRTSLPYSDGGPNEGRGRARSAGGGTGAGTGGRGGRGGGGGGGGGAGCGGGGGEPDDEGGADADLGLEADLAAVALGDLADDGPGQAGAGGGARTALVGAREP